MLADRAENRPLVIPQEIGRGEDHARDGHGPVHPMRLKGAEQDQKFTDKSIRSGQPDRGHPDDQEKRGQQGHLRGDTSAIVEERIAEPVIEKPGQEKEPRGGKSQIDHLQQTALQPLEIQSKQAQYDEPQVADAAEDEQASEVRLHDGDDCPPDNGGQRQTHDDHHHGGIGRGFRQQWETESQEPVRAQLDARQHHGHPDRPLYQRVRQPRVERKDRSLEGQSHEDEPEDQELIRDRDRYLQQVQQIETVGIRDIVVIQTQQGETDQHEHAAQQGIQHVLERGVVLVLTHAPEFDQEITGHEHELPEHEEENQVDGHENPHNRRFQSQDTHEVRFGPVLHGIP